MSQAAALLDEQLEAWRSRPLGRYHYLYLDARYEKVRQDGQVRDAAFLIAVGVNEEGKREVLGVSVALREQEVHWRSFLQSLTQRGLDGVELITSDAHAGFVSSAGSIWWCALAALSVSSSAKCTALRASEGNEERSGG